jgi:chaperone required for assembly of F1-ATPase
MPAMTEETADERMNRLSKDRYERPLPKRFYKTVTISDDNAILLDGRAVKTPMKAPFVLPNRAHRRIGCGRVGGAGRRHQSGRHASH